VKRELVIYVYCLGEPGMMGEKPCQPQSILCATHLSSSKKHIGYDEMPCREKLAELTGWGRFNLLPSR
jgi:hypothetical protein